MIGPIEADSSKNHPQFLDDSFLPPKEIVDLGTFPEHLPSRELTYPTWEKENHFQNAIFGGDVLVPWRVLIIFGLPGVPREFPS